VLFVSPQYFHFFSSRVKVKQSRVASCRALVLLNRIPLLRLPPQAGFALLEAGSVRAKNTKNILLKNVLDACLGGLIWWTIGYPIALGDMGGDSKANTAQPFFMDRIEGKSSHTYYAMWMFQWAFAAAAATIVSVSTTFPPEVA
jgi:ammonia channel protein AmtB